MKDPYDGDALGVSYGSPTEDGRLGKSYELETLSPALFLRPGESFSHRNRIYHIFGPKREVSEIYQKYRGPQRSIIESFEIQTSI